MKARPAVDVKLVGNMAHIRLAPWALTRLRILRLLVAAGETTAEAAIQAMDEVLGL